MRVEDSDGVWCDDVPGCSVMITPVPVPGQGAGQYQGYHSPHLTSLYLLLKDWLILPPEKPGAGPATSSRDRQSSKEQGALEADIRSEIHRQTLG